jgi:hypothetical protein
MLRKQSIASPASRRRRPRCGSRSPGKQASRQSQQKVNPRVGIATASAHLVVVEPRDGKHVGHLRLSGHDVFEPRDAGRHGRSLAETDLADGKLDAVRRRVLVVEGLHVGATIDKICDSGVCVSRGCARSIVVRPRQDSPKPLSCFGYQSTPIKSTVDGSSGKYSSSTRVTEVSFTSQRLGENEIRTYTARAGRRSECTTS